MFFDLWVEARDNRRIHKNMSAVQRRILARIKHRAYVYWKYFVSGIVHTA